MNVTIQSFFVSMTIHDDYTFNDDCNRALGSLSRLVDAPWMRGGEVGSARGRASTIKIDACEILDDARGVGEELRCCRGSSDRESWCIGELLGGVAGRGSRA
jgi:hypothetical protein